MTALAHETPTISRSRSPLDIARRRICTTTSVAC
jgi:hypothetical protein